MKTKQQIIEELFESKEINEIITNICGIIDDDLQDLIQDIYMTLLEKDDDLIETLYKKNQLKYFIIKIIKNNLFSSTSPFYYIYKKPTIHEDIDKYTDII